MGAGGGAGGGVGERWSVSRVSKWGLIIGGGVGGAEGGVEGSLGASRSVTGVPGSRGGGASSYCATPS